MYAYCYSSLLLYAFRILIEINTFFLVQKYFESVKNNIIITLNETSGNKNIRISVEKQLNKNKYNSIRINVII